MNTITFAQSYCFSAQSYNSIALKRTNTNSTRSSSSSTRKKFLSLTTDNSSKLKSQARESQVQLNKKPKPAFKSIMCPINTCELDNFKTSEQTV